MDNEFGEHVIFYTSCGDVYVKPIFFNYKWCDFYIDYGLMDELPSDNEAWKSKHE